MTATKEFPGLNSSKAFNGHHADAGASLLSESWSAPSSLIQNRRSDVIGVVFIAELAEYTAIPTERFAGAFEGVPDGLPAPSQAPPPPAQPNDMFGIHSDPASSELLLLGILSCKFRKMVTAVFNRRHLIAATPLKVNSFAASTLQKVCQSLLKLFLVQVIGRSQGHVGSWISGDVASRPSCENVLGIVTHQWMHPCWYIVHNTLISALVVDERLLLRKVMCAYPFNKYCGVSTLNCMTSNQLTMVFYLVCDFNT